jgi:hypothetical protein
LAGGFSGSTLNITSVVMANNTAGGICTGSCATPPTNVITGQGGGLVYFGPTLTLSGSTFSGNSTYQSGSYGGGPSAGGGLLFGNNEGSASGTQSITNSIFTNNTGGDGGGAELQIGTGSTVTISGSTFTGNRALQDTGDSSEPSGYGGAIDSSQGTGYTLTISNSRIAGNIADVAGSGFSVLSARRGHHGTTHHCLSSPPDVCPLTASIEPYRKLLTSPIVRDAIFRQRRAKDLKLAVTPTRFYR